MAFWNRLAKRESKSVESHGPCRTQRTCHFETMEPRRMLDADPLFVGSVFIEDDSGADAAGDQFYVTFQGGSATTEMTRLVIDTNQDGDATQLSEPDVYFDVDGTNQQEGKSPTTPTYAAVTSRSHHSEGVNVALLDGSTHFVPNNIDIRVWRAYATRSGGEAATSLK